VITPEISIDQQQLMDGHYSLRKLQESGRHLFVQPFTKEDGYGEGPTGPRRSVQEIYPGLDLPWLRLNGLDAQSCLECHNSIGGDPLYDSETGAMGRKFGVVGGSAGLSANAFINPLFPRPITHFIRNAPHVFGTGYIQQLAEEMTLELLSKREEGRLLAMASPDTPVAVDLTAKGTDYGSITIVYSTESQTFEEDLSGLEGVSEDLVVRGLQWKGIASNERNFVRDAMNFHFSIQPEELFYEEDGKGGVIIGATDGDADGLYDEFSPGNVSALTFFTLSIRPPAVQVPDGETERYERGRSLFLGIEAGADPPHEHACASCHTPSLRIADTLAVVLDPRLSENFQKIGIRGAGLPNQTQGSDNLPIVQRFNKSLAKVDLKSVGQGALFEEVLKADRKSRGVGEKGQPLGYQFDLTEMTGALPLSFPRLPENPDGSVDVPLFSDMKRHDMGVGLSDSDPQRTDTEGVFVPERFFLTRPLWGVGDTGPWLHDARAFSLREAILLHRSQGSEATPAIDRFDSLSPQDQEALIFFLTCLRLPEEGALQNIGEQPEANCDLNGDGKIDAQDQFIFMEQWHSE
jgi:hypothetical protein